MDKYDKRHCSYNENIHIAGVRGFRGPQCSRAFLSLTQVVSPVSLEILNFKTKVSKGVKSQIRSCLHSLPKTPHTFTPPSGLGHFSLLAIFSD